MVALRRSYLDARRDSPRGASRFSNATSKWLNVIDQELPVPNPHPKGIKITTIWKKGVSVFNPEYFVEFLPTGPWIHQPFENYDRTRPHQLAR